MKYFGEGGLITKLERKIDRIIGMYAKTLEQEGDASYTIDSCGDSIYVEFTRHTCVCCPGEEVGGFRITEAMLNHPKVEIGKLFDEKEQKRKKKEEKKKAKEVERKRLAKIERGKQYARLKKEFDEGKS